jgi:hypothetical protein
MYNAEDLRGTKSDLSAGMPTSNASAYLTFISILIANVAVTCAGYATKSASPFTPHDASNYLSLACAAGV